MELAKFTEGKLEELARGHADLAYAQIGQVAEIVNIMERQSSVERSLHGNPSPSPIPGRRGPSPSAETLNVSVPTTSGYLGPLSITQVRRNKRLQSKPRPD